MNNTRGLGSGNELNGMFLDEILAEKEQDAWQYMEYIEYLKYGGKTGCEHILADMEISGSDSFMTIASAPRIDNSNPLPSLEIIDSQARTILANMQIQNDAPAEKSTPSDFQSLLARLKTNK